MMWKNTYVEVMLGKNQILVGRVWRRTVPMACTHYVGCVLGLLLLGGWREEPECDELQNGRFC
jgi:hypothetical protein